MCDNKSTLIGLSNGHLRLISWNAEVFTNVLSILFLFVRDYHNINVISLWFFNLQYSDSFRLCCGNSPSDVPSTSKQYPNLPSHSTGCAVQNSSITHLEFSTHLRILVVLYSNGQIELCSVSKKGLRQSSGIIVERWLTTEGATCTSFASDQKILAVGCSRGVVELYDLSESAQVLRTISLFDWGYVSNCLCFFSSGTINEPVMTKNQ